jgi:cytochrome c oxidase assembly factor CtaG
MRREPERGAIREPLRAFYLFASSILMFVPATFLAFSPLPLYGLYELAPPLWLGFDPVSDQQLAGVLMNVVGGLALWTVIAIGFMRWARAEERADAEARRRAGRSAVG